MGEKRDFLEELVYSALETDGGLGALRRTRPSCRTSGSITDWSHTNGMT